MRRSLVPLYYLATPLFAAVDLGLGVPVRAAGLERPFHRVAWYALAFAVGLLMRRRPRLTPWLGIGESTANLTLLMVAVLLPIWSLPESLDTGAAAELPARVTNLALSGSVLVFSIYRSQVEALGSIRGGRPRPTSGSLR